MPVTATHTFFSGKTTIFQDSQLSRRPLATRKFVTGHNSIVQEQVREMNCGFGRAGGKQKTLRRATDRLEKRSINKEEAEDLYGDTKGEVMKFGDSDGELKNERTDNENEDRAIGDAGQEDGVITSAQDHDQNIHQANHVFSSAEEEYFYFTRGEMDLEKEMDRK